MIGGVTYLMLPNLSGVPLEKPDTGHSWDLKG